MHQNIYAANQLPAKGKILDNAVSALLDDLKANGHVRPHAGSDGGRVRPDGRSAHRGPGPRPLPQQFALFAGGGVKGGRIIGATNALGSDVANFGWSRQRYVYPEDIEATIYSAMGIDWTTVRHDDPLGRGFEYVPFSEQDLYGPVNELWGS